MLSECEVVKSSVFSPAHSCLAFAFCSKFFRSAGHIVMVFGAAPRWLCALLYHERVRRKRSLCFLTPKAVSVGDGEMLKQHEVPWNHCSCMGYVVMAQIQLFAGIELQCPWTC